MSLLDIFFPRCCVGCGKLGAYFCRDCTEKIRIYESQRCPVCARTAFEGTTHYKCCGKEQLDGLVSVFPYRDTVGKALVQLKYRFASDLAESLVRLVFEKTSREYFGFLRYGRGWTLVPVPLYWRRQNWRGFNQAEILGKLLADGLKIKFTTDLLIRKRKTDPQVGLDKEARRKNIQGAFSVKPDSVFIIRDSKFILFDDVWTTGATVSECGRILKRAGAGRVWGLTLAR